MHAPHKPHTWWRSIDGIFMIWTHLLEDVNAFTTYLNGMHPPSHEVHVQSLVHICKVTCWLLSDRMPDFTCAWDLVQESSVNRLMDQIKISFVDDYKNCLLLHKATMLQHPFFFGRQRLYHQRQTSHWTLHKTDWQASISITLFLPPYTHQTCHSFQCSSQTPPNLFNWRDIYLQN